MAGTFQLKKIRDLDIQDPFFDSLKKDYSDFEQWFEKISREDRTALVFSDEEGLGAFVSLKEEDDEEIVLKDKVLPRGKRLKISTFRIAERYRKQRLGEGAIGLALWKWQSSSLDEVYITVYKKYETLIELFQRFGFKFVGELSNGECVYMRSKNNIDYSDPYKSFPFIDPSFTTSGYVIIDQAYHDTMFPYAELKNTLQESVALNVRNGLTKIYVGAQYTAPPYSTGDPVFIYRKYTDGNGQPRYKSCITSYCVVTDIVQVKENHRPLISYQDLVDRIGNKSVFNESELRKKYDGYRDMIVIEMLYYGFFGSGNNVNFDYLISNGFWGAGYPATIAATKNDFIALLKEGNVNVQNVIVD